MKSFTSFFTEARVSQASQQAERRGLTGDGHGNWMDKEGNIVARTEQGRLVLLDKKVKAPQQEAPKKVKKAKEKDIKDDKPTVSAELKNLGAVPYKVFENLPNVKKFRKSLNVQKLKKGKSGC